MYRFIAFLLLCTAISHAQDRTSRLKVAFDCTCSDKTGSLFATAFRDALANSPRYIEGQSSEKYEGKTIYNLKVSAVSVSLDDQGDSAAIAETFLIGDTYYVNTLIQTCIAPKAKSCADGLLAMLDAEVHKK
jgi:hypothetical protein